MDCPQIVDEQIEVISALAKLAAGPGCCFLEVGSWMGDSTKILGKIAKENQGKLFCVDWWKGSPGTDLAQAAKEKNVFSSFWNRMISEGLEDTVVPIRGSSEIVLPILGKNTFDLIFIDGDHRYNSAIRDIRLSLPLVKADKGILCGHDCEGYPTDFEPDFLEAGRNQDQYEGVHCGVVLAVGETFSQYSLYRSIWCVQRREEGGDPEWSPVSPVLPHSSVGKQATPPWIGFTESHNICRVGSRVYAIPHHLQGQNPLSLIESGNSSILSAPSLQDLQSILNEPLRTQDPPVLLERFQDYNLVQYNGKFSALFLGLGALDLHRLKEQETSQMIRNRDLFVGQDLESLKEEIRRKGKTLSFSHQLREVLGSLKSRLG